MEVDISLFEWQNKVFNQRKRFNIISAGRQSGKTHFCIFLLISHALGYNNNICWWVAPTYEPSKIAFRRCLILLNSYKIVHKVNYSELSITLKTNSSIRFKSADREEGLRGETVDFLVIDEMGLIKRDSWDYALRGTITVTRASVWFIGTPKGKNLFYELYCLGQDKEENDYISYQIESTESPLFSDEEWQRVKRLPQRVFEQEYQAKFIDEGGEVFRNIRECIRGKLEPERNIRKTYYCGVDLAKSYDYTVICIIDNNGHLVYFDRFNDISWNIQKERIKKGCFQYDAVSWIDSTGVGDPIFEDLSKDVKAQGYKFTNASKRQLIEGLSVSIERGEISFPEIPELINELSIFAFEQSETGLIKYNAPSGMHDDIVISLALANYGYGQNRGFKGALTSDGERESLIQAW